MALLLRMKHCRGFLNNAWLDIHLLMASSANYFMSEMSCSSSCSVSSCDSATLSSPRQRTGASLNGIGATSGEGAEGTLSGTSAEVPGCIGWNHSSDASSLPAENECLSDTLY